MTERIELLSKSPCQIACRPLANHPICRSFRVAGTRSRAPFPKSKPALPVLFGKDGKTGYLLGFPLQGGCTFPKSKATFPKSSGAPVGTSPGGALRPLAPSPVRVPGKCRYVELRGNAQSGGLVVVPVNIPCALPSTGSTPIGGPVSIPRCGRLLNIGGRHHSTAEQQSM